MSRPHGPTRPHPRAPAGRLQCLGSGLFLKKAFGCGYSVTVMRSMGADMPALRRRLLQVAPDASVASEVPGCGRADRESSSPAGRLQF